MTLNIGNIKEGQVFKSYRDLCRALDEVTRKGTNSKDAHLKELSRYFNFSKIPDSTKYQILSIYTEVQPKEPRKVSDDLNRYSMIFLSYLYNKINKDYIFVKKFQLFKECGFIDDYYYSFKKETNIDETFPEITKIELLNFYSISYTYLSDTLRSMLNNLSNTQKIISYEDTRMCFDPVENRDRYCTIEENNMIVAIERKLLDQLELKSTFSMSKKTKAIFYFEVNQQAKEEGLNIQNIQKGYKIGFNPNLTENEVSIYSKNADVIANDQILTNEYIRNQVKAKAKKDYDKYIKHVQSVDIQKPVAVAKPQIKTGKSRFSVSLEDLSYLDDMDEKVIKKLLYTKALYKSNYLNNNTTLTDALMGLDIDFISTQSIESFD